MFNSLPLPQTNIFNALPDIIIEWVPLLSYNFLPKHFDSIVSFLDFFGTLKNHQNMEENRGKCL